MHQCTYDLERFGPRPWEDLEDNGDTPMPADALALEETEHAINVAILLWIEALCVHEIGQDWLFAPSHIYASSHWDLEEHGGRSQGWLVLFYGTALFASEVGENSKSDFGLRVLRDLDPKGDIMVQSVYLTTPNALDTPAEELLYQRIDNAAQSHAAGNSAIMPLADALELATSSVH